MKQYLLSVCYPAGSEPPTPDALTRIMQNVAAVQKDMQAAGVWTFSGGLTPPGAATVVHPRDDAFTVTDGPFIETKEIIGGITILRLPDLESALAWARRLSGATTTPVEVRPFLGPGS